MVVLFAGTDAMVPKRRTLLTVGLVAAMLLSGCLGTGPLSDEQENQVAEQFEQRFGEIDGFTATVHSEMDGENVSVDSTAKVWQRPNDGEMRQEVLAPADQEGDVSVSNGSTSIYYDASENTYTKVDLSGALSADSRDVGTQLQNLLDRFEVHYNGTASVDGENTHKVTLVPENDSQALSGYQMTLWLDDENYFPVKQQMTSDDLGFESTTHYENVSLNPGIADERFEFEPPAGATERETGFENYETRDELAAATNLTLPEPAVPSGYAFEGGSVSTFDGNTSATIHYTSGEDSLSIVVQESVTETTEGDETVDVGNQTGQYSETAGISSLSWTCTDRSYSVMGNADKETVTDVGASIECSA